MMTVEYDLVAIGGLDGFTPNNTHELVSRAAQSGARVALVTNHQLIASTRAAQIAAQVLQHAQSAKAQSFSWPDLHDRFNQYHNPNEQLEALQIQGVDVIWGDGKFCDRQTLVVTETGAIASSKPESINQNQRVIRSRNFAIASTPSPTLRKVVGLETVDYINCDRLWQLPKLPSSIAIIGGDATSCTIAQALSYLGCEVTMLVAETHILGDRAYLYTDRKNAGKNTIQTQTDGEVARLLQAHLEISHLTARSSHLQGNTRPDRPDQSLKPIAIYTNHRVTAIAPIDAQNLSAAQKPTDASSKDHRDRHNPDRSAQSLATNIKIWAGDRTFTAEQLLIPAWGNEVNQLPFKLGLRKAGVSISANSATHGLHLNSKCQTNNRRIYGCRSVADVDIVLQNTLFLPTAKRHHHPSLQRIATQPAIASLGMGEIAARLAYGQDLNVLHLSRSTQSHLKLICRTNGQIVGAHGIGANVLGVMPVIAIAMTKKIRLNQLANLSQICPDQHTDPNIQTLIQAANRFEYQRLQRRGSLRDWLEQWFMWRRDFNL
jgi:pyruvate/2-oxoglutarate dehydrogenase complex dihydrolipoamide dehydrogenase (E3) component